MPSYLRREERAGPGKKSSRNGICKVLFSLIYFYRPERRPETGCNRRRGPGHAGRAK